MVWRSFLRPCQNTPFLTHFLSSQISQSFEFLPDKSQYCRMGTLELLYRLHLLIAARLGFAYAEFIPPCISAC